eukprot:363074-Chlamydomonas_euryale.AAC.20
MFPSGQAGNTRPETRLQHSVQSTCGLHKRKFLHLVPCARLQGVARLAWAFCGPSDAIDSEDHAGISLVNFSAATTAFRRTAPALAATSILLALRPEQA